MLLRHKINTAKGALVGLAMGDALGTTLEFSPRTDLIRVTDILGGGPFNLEPGQWTDDTSMMLCLADSLIESGKSDTRDQMRRYLDWRNNGYNSCTGTCFDIGGTISKALIKFESDGKPLAGSSNPQSAGNGSLMRIAPVALMMHNKKLSSVLKTAKEVSKTTHGEQRCIDACQYLTYLIHTLLRSATRPEKHELLLNFSADFSAVLDGMHEDSLAVIQGSYRNKIRDQIKSSGYVVDSLEAALWCFWHSDNFESGAILAANLGDDADTVAAIYGQLAGAYYGYDRLPSRWLGVLAWQAEIAQKAGVLIERPTTGSLLRFADACRNITDQECHSGGEFYDIAYKHKLVLTSVDWGAWINHNPHLLAVDALATANVEQCLCLVTYLVRGERFHDGLIKRYTDNGVIGALVERVRILAQRQG